MTKPDVVLAFSPIPLQPGRRPALNAVRAGMFASGDSVLADEDPAEFKKIELRYAACFSPSPGPHADAVNDLVRHEWRRQRLVRVRDALVRDAVARASDRLPESVRGLAAQIQRQTIGLTIVETLLDKLHRLAKGRVHGKAFLNAVAPVLDPLLGWDQSVRDVEVQDVCRRAGDQLNGRRAINEESRRRLAGLVDECRAQIDGVRADAELLAPDLAERLRREVSGEERAIQRQLELLRSWKSESGVENHRNAGTTPPADGVPDDYRPEEFQR